MTSKPSTSGGNGRWRPWYARRRTRSVGSIQFCRDSNSNYSDEMCCSGSGGYSTSKDTSQRRINSSLQSDSDDGIYENSTMTNVNPTFHLSCRLFPNNTNTPSSTTREHILEGLESDSFHENSPCRKFSKRKRKFKKIAMDMDMSPSSRFHYPCMVSHKKKRFMRVPSHTQSGRFWLNGKRKRSLRQKSKPCLDGSSGDGEYATVSKDAKVLGISRLSLNDRPEEFCNAMDVSYTVSGISSSSISSSGSETGIFTNDEGREGDDEQSDWICDTTLSMINNTTSSGEVGNSLLFFRNKDQEPVSRILRKKSRSTKYDFGLLLPPSAATMDTDEVMGTSGVSNLNRKKPSDMGNVNVTIPSRRPTFCNLKRRKRVSSLSSTMGPSVFVMERSSSFNVSTTAASENVSDESSDSKDSMRRFDTGEE